MTQIFGQVSGRSRFPAEAAGAPLVIAIHGGTYDCAYFDVPGHSLLDRADANGVSIIAIDRPGYGETPLLSRDDMSFAGQARFLADALRTIWDQHGAGRPGMVVIAHSIGAAIALTLASDPGDLPLLGLAVSGVGLRTPPGHDAAWAALPETDMVTLPADMKEMVMFGPEGSFDRAAVVAARAANRAGPKAELLEITGLWHANAPAVLGRIAVPVHYRQGEGDRLWMVDEGEVRGFAQALARSPRVDAAMLAGTGHCLDFHAIGPAFQLAQLSFALQCGAEARYPR